MKWIINKMKRAWARFKVWVLSILVALGLVTGGLLYAETKTISWTMPNTRVDGTDLPISEIDRSNLYCGPDLANFAFIATVPAPTPFIDQDFAVGTHLCGVTVVDTSVKELESDLSNIITIVILAAKPSPPILNEITPSGG